MNTPQKLVFQYLCLFVIVLLSTACSATPNPSSDISSDSTPDQVANQSDDPLGQILQQAQKQQQALEREDKRYPKGIPSVSTFAFFTSTPLVAHQEKYQGLLAKSIQKQMQHAKISKNWHRKIQERFSLVSVAIDQNLPINVDLFKSMPSPLSATVKQSPDIMFVRYAGPAMNHAKHLKFLCQGLLDVSQALQKSKQPFAIAHLNTLQLLDVHALQTLCQAAPTAWVRPAIELADKDQVRFISRGLAQFGQADLESNVMSKRIAPQWLRNFQLDMQSLVDAKVMRVGQVWKGHTLQACQRANYHYDLECILIDYSKSK